MTLTKEQLQQIIETDHLQCGEASALARIALASLEAEAVAYIRDGFRADGVHFCGGIITAEEHERTKPALSDRYNWKHQPLYTAPPAPVVPDAMKPVLKDGEIIAYERHGERFSTVAGAAWNTCRAAMLQGAEPVSQRDELPANVIDALEKALQAMSFMGDTLNALDAVCEEDVEYVTPAFEAVRQVLEGNSPAIPDGWVACSERMPEGMQTVITSNGFDIGQAWWDGEGWNSFDCHDVVPGAVTHWMPLPAAPQQEAK
ncbi:hypothetical protein C3433_13375 [Citrobacter freundii]|nr:hypothetical protein C3433_13375 [Citrobacter freundii]